MISKQFTRRIIQSLVSRQQVRQVRSQHVSCTERQGVRSAIEEQYVGPSVPPTNEEIQEPILGSVVRGKLVKELTELCRRSCVVACSAGGEASVRGDHREQVVPFDISRVAAHYYAAWRSDIQDAIDAAVAVQSRWERTPVLWRLEMFERAADLLSKEFRARVVAAAMVGSAMTAVQAEYNVCQLIDHIRFNCKYMRELMQCWSIVSDGQTTRNRNQYHGLEGFWAAITPYDSFAHAAQLAITPAIMGNVVVWKPADEAVLVCHRVYEVLLAAGLPAGVINFVPADKHLFLEVVTASPYLAGVSFGGQTTTLEKIYRSASIEVDRKSSFPRIVGTGSGKGFHLVHSSADLDAAVSCTARAAFEMSGQKATSCARVVVAESVSRVFVSALRQVAETLVVCSPLDYRCFTTAVASHTAWEQARAAIRRARRDPVVGVVCGARCAGNTGWYVAPTVLVVSEPAHPALTLPVRAPVLAVTTFPDGDLTAAAAALSHCPFALTGSVFAQDVEWARDAVSAVRNFAGTLSVNERCSEITPGLQALGGGRKSGSGAKAGSISYLLQFAHERSVSECLRPCRDVTYSYMDEVPQQPRLLTLE